LTISAVSSPVTSSGTGWNGAATYEWTLPAKDR
jgi:hypothetical protein